LNLLRSDDSFHINLLLLPITLFLDVATIIFIILLFNHYVSNTSSEQEE